MSDLYLFTELVRQKRPLSEYLRRRPEVRRVFAQIGEVESLAELDAFASDLRDVIKSATPEYPQLEEPTHGRVDEFGGEMRRVSDGVREPTTRYHVKFVLEGDPELLQHWPDRSEQSLQSVHHELMERIGGYENFQNCADEDAREYWRLHPTWQLHMVQDGGPWAVCTYFDLTRDEESLMAEEAKSLRALVDERYERLAPIVTEIKDQARRFFEAEFPAAAVGLIDERRRTLTQRAALLKDLTVPLDWSNKPLELATAVPQSAVATHVISELELGTSYRLSPKSFAEVLRTVRTWADAVERNPGGFGHLDEDGISDLLAATLNATVPNAGREVFSRSGKVDVHVIADVIAEGSGPAAVFLCETKWAAREAQIHEALEQQLFRYLTAHSTSAALVALCRQKNFHAAQLRVQQWAAVAGYIETVDGPINGWPHNLYRVDGRVVEVCIATVELPRTTTRAGKPR